MKVNCKQVMQELGIKTAYMIRKGVEKKLIPIIIEDGRKKPLFDLEYIRANKKPIMEGLIGLRKKAPVGQRKSKPTLAGQMLELTKRVDRLANLIEKQRK